MNAEKNKYFVSSHAELDSASYEVLNLTTSEQGNKRNRITSLNENAQNFIVEMELTIKEIKLLFKKTH